MSDPLKQIQPNMEHIQEALTAKRSPDELTAQEQEIYHEKYMESLWTITPEQKAFFAEQIKAGKGVGLDDEGNTLYQS